MNITREIERTVSHLNEGAIFKYEDLPLYGEKPGAVVKAVCRLTRDRRVVRLARGRYYKPRRTPFGMARPREADIVNAYLFSGRRQVGYITGPALYNKWGLNSQLPAVVEIATAERCSAPRLTGLKIRMVKPTHGDITRKNAELLQLLDVIKNIRRIPDARPEVIVAVLMGRLEELSGEELKHLERIAVESYGPATCALLGALIESCRGYSSPGLEGAINRLSRYSAGPIRVHLPNGKRWCLI